MHVMNTTWAIAVFFGLAGVACSSSSNDAGTSGAALQAPELTEVAPMTGVLHVTWKNLQADCDTVEGERKTKGDYAMVFTTPGAVDNKMDTAASDDVTYTYRLRCKKGSAYSAYSNEMSGNPMGMDGGVSPDAGMDAGPDAAMDMGRDMGMDMGMDMGKGMDMGTDMGMD